MPVLIAEIESRCNRQRLGNAGTFNQQIIKPSFSGQVTNLHQQVFAQRTADASIAHFDQFFFGSGKIATTPLNQISINIDFTHVIDDDRDLSAIPVVENMIEKCRFSSAQKPR